MELWEENQTVLDFQTKTAAPKIHLPSPTPTAPLLSLYYSLLSAPLFLPIIPISSNSLSKGITTMRVSCNGCRVLRKGCTENCSIKPCLQWIISPESQSNATLFLAKFYGRAGLQNLINAGPDHLRPAIFRSLLYEACGRIVNPIYGSAGLLCSGNWQLCHAAVEAVLSGTPITQVSPESDAGTISPPLKACDIRHVSKDGDESAASRVLHKVKTSRGRFKRSGTNTTTTTTGSKQKRVPAVAMEVEPAVDEAAQVMWSWSHQDPKLDRDRSGSHESVMTHPAEPPSRASEGDMVSMETVEASPSVSDGSDVELELTLGSKPNPKMKESSRATQQEEEEENQSDGDRCRVELGLSCSPPVLVSS